MHLMRLHSRIRRGGKIWSWTMSSYYSLLKCHRFFGFALQRVALFVTQYCVDEGEGVQVCVRGHKRERERVGIPSV